MELPAGGGPGDLPVPSTVNLRALPVTAAASSTHTPQRGVSGIHEVMRTVVLVLLAGALCAGCGDSGGPAAGPYGTVRPSAFDEAHRVGTGLPAMPPAEIVPALKAQAMKVDLCRRTAKSAEPRTAERAEVSIVCPPYVKCWA